MPAKKSKDKKLKKKEPEAKKKEPLGVFLLANKLLTIRFWSRTYTTSLFTKKIKDYNLLCQYPLSNFNLSILRDTASAQTYLKTKDKLYISRLKLLNATIDPKIVTISFQLHSIRLKASHDMEFATPAAIFEEILADKRFFIYNGKKLDGYVKPLGLIRKSGETDPSLRRRTLEYLNYKLDGEEQFASIDWEKLRGGGE